MIDVTMRRHRDEYTFIMTGHAVNSSGGSEIVCAACSAIAYSLMGFLLNSRDVICTDEMYAVSGNMRIRAKCTRMVTPAFEMAYIGIAQLHKNYPEYISIKNMQIS